jgi:hypothetical protein
MRRQDAETIALQALGWMASDGEALQHFCAATGMAPGILSQAAEDAHFLAGVLDFLSQDETAARTFTVDVGLDPARLAEARAALPGGDLPHWT